MCLDAEEIATPASVLLWARLPRGSPTRSCLRTTIRAARVAPLAVMSEADARAIRATLERAAPEDLVLIAGKGHEDYQIYGAERRAFLDQSVVRAYFAEHS